MSSGRQSPPMPSAVLFAALLALSGCDEAEDRASQPPRPVDIGTVAAVTEAQVHRLPGITEIPQRAPLSFEVSGRVASVAVTVGDRVAEGDTLAQLEERTYRLTVEQRRNDLREAEATLADADAELSRNRQLFDEGWVSEAALISVRSRRNAAQSRVESLQAALSRAEEDLADTVLEAPYAGTIAARRIEPSQQVTAGQTVFEIQGTGTALEILVQVPETLVDRIDRDGAHRVTSESLGLGPRAGRLTELSPQTGGSNAFQAVIEVEADPSNIRAGATAEVALQLQPTGDADGADTTLRTIPLTAYLPRTDGDALVFRLAGDATDDGSEVEAVRVEAVAVTVVSLTDDHATVRGPLEPGDEIVARGVSFLTDGMAVSRLDDGPARYNP